MCLLIYKRKKEESDEEASEKLPRIDETSVQHKQEETPPQETTDMKRELPEETEGGSLFDMMNAHLKKKQKTLPADQDTKQGNAHRLHFA